MKLSYSINIVCMESIIHFLKWHRLPTDEDIFAWWIKYWILSNHQQLGSYVIYHLCRWSLENSNDIIVHCSSRVVFLMLRNRAYSHTNLPHSILTLGLGRGGTENIALSLSKLNGFVFCPIYFLSLRNIWKILIKLCELFKLTYHVFIPYKNKTHTIFMKIKTKLPLAF